MRVQIAARWAIRTLITLGLLTIGIGIIQATNPIGGKTHSFDGNNNVGAASNDVSALLPGDLDRDGYVDLAYGAGTELAIIQNDGTPLNGWPTRDIVGTAGNSITDLALADLDQDGAIDIASVTGGSGNNEVRLWQNPNSPFTNSWTVSKTLTNSLAISITSVAAVDLDQDSYADLVTGGSDGSIQLWANPLTATASFSDSWGNPYNAASAAAGIKALAVGDLDRDGQVDLVTAAGGTVTAWQNPGSPFSTAWTVSNTLGTLANNVLSLVVADLDGDGRLDVAVGDEVGNIFVWRNPLTPASSFGSSWGSGLDIGDGAGAMHDLQAADPDGDGDPDLISASGSSVQSWQNDASPFSGSWSLTTLGSSTDTVYAVTSADLDHDGDPEVVSGSGANEDYEIILWTNTLVHQSEQYDIDDSGFAFGTLDARFRVVTPVDLDGDGDLDLVTGSDWHSGPELVAWENDGSPFESGWNQSNLAGDLFTVYSIVADDLDGDGDMDLLTGQDRFDSSARLIAWENDGSPFVGAWISNTIGVPRDRVEGLALGDLDNDGDPDAVTGTGFGQWNASTAYRVTAWENDGSPFDNSWSYNDVYTVTYSVHSVSVGDLDNDGWLDIVAGVNHAPVVGSASDPAPPEDWHENFELRAYQNDGSPFGGAWSQTYVGRDPETATFAAGVYHGYWGATIYFTALSDLDGDGDLDIATTEHIEGDIQVKVWQNDGTPFDGLPQSTHWTWEPTAVFYNQPPAPPWMGASVYEVIPGDFNQDGNPDLATVSGEYYETLYFENDGRPFGANISDTTWIRHNLGRYTDVPALAIAAGDFDKDGDLDLVHGSGHYYQTGTTHDLLAWKNHGGSAQELADSTAPEQVLQGSTDDLLAISLAHGGISADHDLEPAEWRLLLEESAGDPLTSTEANAIIDSLRVYLDDGDLSWGATTDTPVVTVTNLSLVAGVQSLSFGDGDPLLQLAHGDSPFNFFVVISATADAASQTPNTMIVTFDPDAHSIIEDSRTDSSVTIQDTDPISTGLITLVGPASQVIVDDLPTRLGTEVMTATLGTGVSLTVYANSHDASGNFRENVVASWSLTDTVGNVSNSDLAAAGDNLSAIFSARRIGAARIQADHATLLDDSTGGITVTLEITRAQSPAWAGSLGGTVVTATLVDKNLNSVTDGTEVSFSSNLGSFSGQSTVTRTTSSGIATATLTSNISGTARITVTGDSSWGWIEVVIVQPSEVWSDDAWAGSDCGDIVEGHTFCFDAFSTVQTAIDTILEGGTAHVQAGTFVENLSIAKDLTLSGDPDSVIAPGSGEALLISSGTVTVTGLTLQGNTGISVTNGTVLAAGNRLENHTVALKQSGGTFYVYANTVLTFSTGIENSGGTLNGRHNWWGDVDPVGINNTEAYTYRLGAPITDWAWGALSDGASISGGSGTGVVVKHGTSIPFGIPAVYSGTACSAFYDFFAAPGASGTWTVEVPVDNGSGCNATFNSGKLFHFALDGNGAPDTSCSPDQACWVAYTGVLSNTGAIRTLEISLDTADLGGTPIIAGNQEGDDPTAITLGALAAWAERPSAIAPILLGLMLLAGTTLILRRKKD